MYNTASWLLLCSCFWSTTDWFGEIKQFHESKSYGALDAHAFFCFSYFLRIWNHHFHLTTCPRRFHWKRHQNGLNYPIKLKKWGSNFKVAPKLCMFHTMQWKLLGFVKEWVYCIRVWWIPFSIVVMHGTLCNKTGCWSICSSSFRLN